MGPSHRRRRFVEFFLNDTLPKLRALFARSGRDPRRSSAPSVLIIEDNKDASDFMALFLESDGFHVSRAYDGLSGLAKARAERPDLIILNYQMPNLDGLDVLRILRNDPHAPKSKVIFESGYPPVAEPALAAGADVFMALPFGFRELRETARRLLAL